MRTTTKTILFLLAGMTATPAMAGTKYGEFDIGGSMTLTTDYVSRGLSNSDRDPSVQGGITINHDTGLYVSATAFSIDFNDANVGPVEIDLAGGYAREFANKVKIDLGLIHYNYPGTSSGLEYNYNEFYVGLGYKYQALGMSAKYSYSPDFGGSIPDNSAYYAEGALTYDLPYEVTAAAHVGHSNGDHFDAIGMRDGYTDYSVGLSKEILGFVTDLSFYGNNEDGRKALGNNAKDQLALKVTKNF
ncbi:MAG: hypothetical protein G8237_02380 [Magnetococcales bacterium]|nr:hypothetical protein [Magnetococcales bacterium]